MAAITQDDSTSIRDLPSHFNFKVEISERKEDFLPLFLALIAVIVMTDPLYIPLSSKMIDSKQNYYGYKTIQVLVGFAVFLVTKYALVQLAS